MKNNLRTRKRNKVAHILREFRGLRQIADIRNNNVRRKLGSVKDMKGKMQHSRQGIVDAFAEFYADLYQGGAGTGCSTTETGGGQETEANVSKVTKEEVAAQLQKMHKKKAADQSGLVVEMLQKGGDAVLEVLADIFNDVLFGGEDPKSWKETRLKVLMKKGDPKVLDNYRPISVISIIYKVFSRTLSERIKETLEKEQSPDQAGFRATCGGDDHLFVLTFL